MLTGMTPASYSLPAGWSLVRAQDFENGCNPTYENCGIGQTLVGAGGRAHSGTNSVYGTYSKDGDQVAVVMYPGTYTEAYVSFYQWIDSGALFTDEFYIADWMKRAPDDSLAQELIIDYIWCSQNAPTNSTCKLDIQAGGNVGYSLIGTYNLNTGIRVIPLGEWVQWEIHYRPNTSGNSNGFMRVYMTPQSTGITDTWMDYSGNLNGTQSMNNLYLYIGGTITRLEWSKRDPNVVGSGACNFPSECGYVSDGCRNFAGLPVLFSNPACGPSQPSFNRYIDDVILMTTGGAPVGDATAPYVLSMNPPPNATGVPTTNRVTQFHVLDSGVGVDNSSIYAVINSITRNAGSSPPLVCTGTSADYTCTFTNGSDRADGQTVDVAITATDLAGNRLSAYTYRYTQGSVATNTYTTSFNTTENPIREDVGAGSVWINGQTTGLDWTNVRTANGNAIGTQSRVLNEIKYDDSQAILKGTWRADQCVEGVIHAQGRGTPEEGGNYSGWGSGCNRELELILRGNLSAHYATPYEILFSSRLIHSYHQIGLWPGPIATDISQFPHLWGDVGDQYIVQDGDVMRACIVGNHITVTKNGNYFSDAYDYEYRNPSGNPGIGFYASNQCDGLERAEDFAWKSFTAEGLLTDNLVILTTSLSNGTAGTAYPAATISAQGGQSPYSFSIYSGSLPSGLSLSSVGVVSGTTSTSGTYNFTVQVVDAVSSTATKSYTIVIVPGAGVTTQNTSFADTWISRLSTDINVNFGTNTTLRVYQDPYGTAGRRSILMDNVDIMSIPANATITAAKLRLYSTGTYDGDGGSNPMLVNAYSLSGSLPDTTTVTWNNFSSTVSAVLSSQNVTLVPGFYEWDVITPVRVAYAAHKPVYLILDGGASGSVGTNRKFASVDHATVAWRPQLSITYQAPINLVPPAAPTGHSVSAGNGQVTLYRGSSTGAVSYNCYRTSNGSTPSKNNGVKIAGITNAYVLGNLTNNVVYKFVFTATNADGESIESSVDIATPIAPPGVVPSPPTQHYLGAGNGYINIFPGTSSGATSYNAYYTTDGTTPTTGSTKITGATGGQRLTATNGLTYKFVFTAVNDTGESLVSTVDTVIPTANDGKNFLINTGNYLIIIGDGLKNYLQ
jgi:hypothetical protein